MLQIVTLRGQLFVSDGSPLHHQFDRVRRGLIILRYQQLCLIWQFICWCCAERWVCYCGWIIVVFYVVLVVLCCFV